MATGGPGTGIIGWTRNPDSTDPLDATPIGQPPGAYIKWNHQGRTFRIDGPDANAVTLIAEQLQTT